MLAPEVRIGALAEAFQRREHEISLMVARQMECTWKYPIRIAHLLGKLPCMQRRRHLVGRAIARHDRAERDRMGGPAIDVRREFPGGLGRDRFVEREIDAPGCSRLGQQLERGRFARTGERGYLQQPAGSEPLDRKLLLFRWPDHLRLPTSKLGVVCTDLGASTPHAPEDPGIAGIVFIFQKFDRSRDRRISAVIFRVSGNLTGMNNPRLAVRLHGLFLSVGC